MADRKELRPHVVNRYETYGEIASGGMATIEYGRLLGPHAFSRPVAIKRLHAHFAKDPAFADMFIDEARLSARLIHANIIPTLDVIQAPGEIALVMEYVHGESLSSLLQHASARGELVPVRVATALVSSVLHGLHAAHEARNERDELLGVVHRDVSPHNVLVGVDGIPRVLDFGIAKAVDQLRSTPNGEIKGKLAYMAPEQLRGEPVDRRADVFGAAAVLWETLTGFMLFEADNANLLVKRVLDEPIRPPSAYVTDLPPELDMIVMRGLTRERELRYASAREMALELERKVGIATQSEVSDWLQQLAGETLRTRAAFLRRLQERGGQALLGRTARSDSGRVTRSVEEEANDARVLGSTPSVETTRPTEVRSAWPWIAGGFFVIGSAVLLLAARLPSDGTARERHALEPVAVPAALPVAAPPAPPMLQAPTPAAGAAAEQLVPARVESTPPRSKSSRARKRVVEASAPTVQPAAIAEPKCARVIYVDGIRRINPDCPQASKPKP